MNAQTANLQEVQVIAARPVETETGEFIALDLASNAFKTSKTSGKAYLAPVKASITTALSKEQAEKLVGKILPGKIERRQLAKPVEWKNPRTGDTQMLTHENVFVPEV